MISRGEVTTVWRTWWLGDAIGALLLVPLAIAWSRPAARLGCAESGRIEAVLMIVAVAALSELATRSHRPLVYLVFPALIWAALRFGPRGATLRFRSPWDSRSGTRRTLEGPFPLHRLN